MRAYTLLLHAECVSIILLCLSSPRNAIRRLTVFGISHSAVLVFIVSRVYQVHRVLVFLNRVRLYGQSDHRSIASFSQRTLDLLCSFIAFRFHPSMHSLPVPSSQPVSERPSSSSLNTKLNCGGTYRPEDPPSMFQDWTCQNQPRSSTFMPFNLHLLRR